MKKFVGGHGCWFRAKRHECDLRKSDENLEGTAGRRSQGRSEADRKDKQTSQRLTRREVAIVGDVYFFKTRRQEMAMRKCVTAIAAIIALTALASSAMAFQGHAAPEPRCVISDYDPPTNVRTQPNGTIIGNLNNGTEIRIIDQTQAIYAGRWPVGALWDFVEVRGEVNGWEPYGWVYDPLVRCTR